VTAKQSIKIDTAYILAGGLSKRMNGEPKGMLEFGLTSLINRTINTLSNSVDSIYINSHLTEYDQLPYQRVPEPNAGNGPLNGILACLDHFSRIDGSKSEQYILVCPCDAPFLPIDLIGHLVASLSANSLASVIEYDGHWQPVFSIWQLSLLDKVRDAVENKDWQGIKIFLRSLGEQLAVAKYPTPDDSKNTLNPFFNVNSIEDLQYAKSLIDLKKP